MSNRIMKIKRNKIMPVIMGLCASLILLSSQTAVAKEGHLKVTSKVQKMVIVKQDGKTSYRFLPASKVLPGEILQYNNYFENISSESTDDIKIVNPIPKHLVYLPNSATGKNTVITFSIDGGKSYAKPAVLTVKRKDGKNYLAEPSDYTHIQWKYLGNLTPKNKQTVSFRARLL